MPELFKTMLARASTLFGVVNSYTAQKDSLNFLIPEIEPTFDSQALSVISGFIQRKRSVGNGNIPFVPKGAGECTLDCVIGMVPSDVPVPQGSYNFLTSASDGRGSSDLIQYPVFNGTAPDALHLMLHPVVGHKTVSVFIFINPFQHQRRISHQGIIRYREKIQFTLMVSNSIVSAGINHRPPENGKDRTAEYRPCYTCKYLVGNKSFQSDESTIAPEILSDNICLVLMVPVCSLENFLIVTC